MVNVDKLSKAYGNRVCVWDVSFDVARGEILGFLGPNGAGKTTTMRMITGFIPPSAGTARVAGVDVTKDPLSVQSRIGYLCEAPPIYREMVVKSYLKFVAGLKRVPRAKQKVALERAIELCGLEHVQNRVIGNLSKGYRQRVGLAQAILPEPEVLILDEPTSGLDPLQIMEIRQRIRELSGEQTVILSTHILPEVTAICTRVVIINEGQIVAQDSIDGITAGGASDNVKVKVARDSDDLAQRIKALGGIQRMVRGEPGVYQLKLDREGEVRERLSGMLVESGAGLIELSPERETLEDVFRNLVTEEDTAA
ncbi:hypothetical protein ABI59_04235 [Acidobacteria bacterium Mor1]|nr:hypothetical protein ABI59_04235 [Acidobacteria bacterium Mor1]